MDRISGDRGLLGFRLSDCSVAKGGQFGQEVDVHLYPIDFARV